MRIAIGGIEHETNTYADASVGRTALDAFPVHRGDELFEEFAGTATTMGGILDGARELGAEVVPTIHAFAQPSGTIEVDAYRSMLDEMCAMLAAAQPLDAVALSLHGAGVVDGIDDMEGDIVRAVRAVVAPGIPIVSTFDLHANVTQQMADVLNAGFGYHLYPHTDMGERGVEAVRLLPRIAELRPVTHVERVPMLIPPATTNFPPASRMNEICREVESRPGVIDCTFFHGFPYVDIPLVGGHIWVTTAGDRELAASCAREVAAQLWAMREDFRHKTLSPSEAVERALAIGGGPVVINETNDNAGGGAPADGTHLLRAMLDAKLHDACFGFIWDPEVARQAHDAGVGAELDVTLGGKTDDLHGAPIHTRATVRTLTDGRFRLQGPLGTGSKVNLGKMARLRIDDIDVIVGSERSQTYDPELFLLHGIDVTRYRIVALKSNQHFRAGFQPIGKAIVTSDAPGLTTLTPWTFPRERTLRPIWPLDPDATYPIPS